MTEVPRADNALDVEVRTRLGSALPFLAIGALCIVVGGAIAAAIAHDPTRHGVWAVAYLVLVGGVAQVVLGLGQGLLRSEPASPRLTLLQLSAWNLGNVAVIIGAIGETPLLVDLGGAMLVAALVAALLAVRRAPAAAAVSALLPAGVALAYRAILLFVLVSIPVGLVLTRTIA